MADTDANVKIRPNSPSKSRLIHINMPDQSGRERRTRSVSVAQNTRGKSSIMKITGERVKDNVFEKSRKGR